MPSKVFSKGDSMSELPQKTSMGGGGARVPVLPAGPFVPSIPRPVPSVSPNPPAPRSGRIDRPMAAAGIGMGMGVVAGVAAQKIKDAEKLAAYKRKPRMADKAPKVNLRKAYQE